MREVEEVLAMVRDGINFALAAFVGMKAVASDVR